MYAVAKYVVAVDRHGIYICIDARHTYMYARVGPVRTI